MIQIILSKYEKIVIILRDSTWVFWCYIILRMIITAFIRPETNLNISLTTIEKVFGVFIWSTILILYFITARLHKKLKKEFHRILFFHFPKQSILVAIIIVVLLEFYIFIR